MVFLCRQVRWQNTSFNFAKRWHFRPPFLSVCCWSCRSFRVSANVWPLGVRAGFRSTKLSTYHQSPIGKQNLNISTSPRMTQNVCWWLVFLLFCLYTSFATLSNNASNCGLSIVSIFFITASDIFFIASTSIGSIPLSKFSPK